MDIDQLIVSAQSPDNAQREAAEAALLAACDANASDAFSQLVEVALDGSRELSSRQFALLSLRKLITLYWGPGFESYRNTSAVDQAGKAGVRSALIRLCLDDSLDAKVRNGASYCVVQVAAVDFPDQWPELLQEVYGAIASQHSLSALGLLHEIYDDVISEEMFFEGGIGFETLSIISRLLETGSNATTAAKVAAAKLFHACLLQMSTVDSHSSDKRRHFIQECIPRAIELLGSTLANVSSFAETAQVDLVAKVYESLVVIKNEFPRKMFPQNTLHNFKLQLFSDLEKLKTQYVVMLQNTDDSAMDTFNECGIFMVEFLSSLLDTPFTTQEQAAIVDIAIPLCSLSTATVESWSGDFNEYVSKETGLQASYSIRDQMGEFLGSLDDKQVGVYFTIILQRIEAALSSFNDAGSITLESIIYNLQCLLLNDEEIEFSQTNELVQMMNVLLDLPTTNPLLRSRVMLVVPKILDKFMDSIPNVKELVQVYLARILESGSAAAADNELIRCSALISFMAFTYFAELPSVLGAEGCSNAQTTVLHIVTKVMEDAEEDTFGLLMETLNQVISANIETTSAAILQQEFSLVMNISSRDAANIQITVESQDCLEKLLESVTTSTYEAYIQMCLPTFINTIKGSQVTAYKYSPLLSLILEFVTIFMKKKPSDGPLPFQICDYLFEPLVDVLTVSTEDETLQLATDAFSYLIYNTEPSVIVPRLETIVRVLERMLSLEVSDSAAMNVGTLVVTVLTRFSAEIQTLIPVILRAAVTRLIGAKNISTQQNLISLLCFLMCSNEQQTVDFLFQLQEESGDTELVAKVLSRWFESFEVVRGEKKIKENIVALTKLYLLADARLAPLHVNGDLIPYDGDLIITRSMAKSMPDRYTQVSPYAKIVKLFVTELGFQTRQPSNEDAVRSAEVPSHSHHHSHAEPESANTGDDDDDWEDVDDALDYDKLKEYIEDEDEDAAAYGEDDADEITGLGDIPQGETQLLVDALKRFATTDANQFGAIYQGLSESEQQLLTQQLL
ncbi:Kap114 protein [Maudiozyma humilis]|uniref:Kap114 protein n=1 Tax=Maudiozyma humilis TaxID=51915 RepID=A0AAV5S028_MAUHU|nr:Kap114 protein [Kazachstania humilis]